MQTKQMENFKKKKYKRIQLFKQREKKMKSDDKKTVLLV